MSSWREFLEDPDGRGSASRFNMVIGVLVGSITVLWLAGWFKLTEGIFGVYMLATGGVYSVGKWRESSVKMQQIKADSPNQPAEPPPPSPATVINVGGDKTEKVQDANITAQGTVNVTSRSKRKPR